MFWEDFEGDSLKDLWNSTGTGSAVVVDAQDGGIVRITTGATEANIHTLDWNNIRSLLVSKKVTIEFRLKLTQTDNIRIWIRLFFDGADNFGFEYNSGAETSWHIEADSGGTTDVDTNVLADTDYHIFRIEAFPTGDLHFYIDTVETANSPITTNITALHLQPQFVLRAGEDAAKSADVDYVYIRQDR